MSSRVGVTVSGDSEKRSSMSRNGPSQNWLTRVGLDLLQRGAPASARVEDPSRTGAPTPRRTPAPPISRRGAGGHMMGVTIIVEEPSRRRAPSQRNEPPVPAVQRTSDSIASISRRNDAPKPADRPAPRPYVDIYDRISERGSMLELD